MFGKERKEENAGVSNSNTFSNAEQFLLVLSWSVNLISNHKDRTLLSSFSSGGGEFSPVIIHSTTSPTPKGAVCPGVASVSSSAGLLEDTSQQHRGLWPQLDPPTSYSHPRSWGKSMDQLARNGDAIEMSDYWANSYSSLYGAVISEKINW